MTTKKLPILLLTSAALSLGLRAQNPVINPFPALNGGSSYTFTANIPVSWSLAPGSKGTINPATGVYQAPAHVNVQQSHGGCQLLPNNHVFNTRIDNLPVHDSSAVWLAQANDGELHYEPAFYSNFIDSTTPKQKIIFTYEPQNDDSFRIIPWPDGKIESGWYAPYFVDDRHYFGVDHSGDFFQEMYNYYPIGTNTAQCLSCNSQGGIKYLGSSYALPKYGATDAAGMFIQPLSLHAQELLTALATKGTINHAIRFTLQNNHIAGRVVWPATTQAYEETGKVPYGARFRLKANFDISSYTPAQQILLTQIKQYGMILADGGDDWALGADQEVWKILSLNDQYFNFNVTPNNFEAVDESSLMVVDTSGNTTVGAETVIATSTKNPGLQTQQSIVLTGVTIGTPSAQLYFQAGFSGEQLTAWINGTSNKTLKWSMSPALGNLSAGGFYTPPATVSSVQNAVITVSSIADPTAMQIINVSVIPTGTIRTCPGQTHDYIDSHGKDWSSMDFSDGGHTYYNAGPWPSMPDSALYVNPWFGEGDTRWDFIVPNGNYRITAKFAEAGRWASGQQVMHLESQGKLIYKNFCIYDVAGGFWKPLDIQMPATVTNGKLSFVLRAISNYTEISALEITPDPGTPSVEVEPTNPGSINLANQKQFYGVSFFNCGDSVTWSISPNIGTISASGLYTAPLNPIPSDVNVKIKATSVCNPSISDSVTITVLKGVPTVRINCGGPEVTDALNQVWSSDYGFSGSSVNYGEPNSITGVKNGQLALYQDARYNYDFNSDFYYNIPTANGPYKVTLKFANFWNANEMVKMDVSMNGDTVVRDLDPVVAAGGIQAAFDTILKTNVTDGTMHMGFTSKSSTYVGAIINAIEFSLDSTAINGIAALSNRNRNNVTVYPNPFSEKTTLRYTLSDNGYVRLTVFDISGNQVRTLVNASQNAGEHFAVLDAGELSGGFYFYRLETAEGASLGKLCLLK